ncbi:MAG TPA: alpha-amylase family glycosyl hydrolase [Opitutales bacterium]|nr:alpha-amylase family glycosyl hydrolase [Opitutales bacterium]
MSPPNNHIQAAYWIRPGQCCVLLARNWKKNDSPPIHLEGKGLKMKKLRHMDPEEIGRFTGYYEDGDHIVFCLNPLRYPHIDFDHDPVRAAGPFNDWGAANDTSGFNLSRAETKSGAPLYKVSVPRERVVMAGRQMTFKFVTQSWHWLTPLRCAPNLIEDKAGNLNYGLNVSRSGRHAFIFEVDGGRGMDQAAEVAWQGEATQPIVPGLFFYDLASEKPCGPSIENGDTVIRLFAPRATCVSVELAQELSFKNRQRLDLDLAEDQVSWEITLDGNFHGWFYRLFVDGPDDGRSTNFDYGKPLLDPWARATVGPEGPAIILYPAKATPVKKAFAAPDWQDLSILECHVRDLVRNAPIKLTEKERLGFAGVTKLVREKHSYLRTLGVNTLEFQPIQQFDSSSREEYHWGYMTNNYFAPCAWYGTEPEKAAQNGEFREMVAACHEQDLSVIIDVVYNHLGEPPNLLFIDKAYYFHLNGEGELMNWSGCGNVLRCESAMSLRLIIESLTHLVEAYDVDGFRFDLAELMSIEVLKQIGDALRKVKPSVVLIAEPWSFRGSIQWDTRMAGFAFWNDGFREFVKAYVKGQSNPHALSYFAKGCTDQMAAWPAQSINYVESHDDRTWIDDITENPDFNGEQPTHNDILRSHMMAALLYSSVGVPMLSSGQDFMRSKGGIHNTYRMGDVNALDYLHIGNFKHSHNYFKSWIAFRKSAWGGVLRLDKTPGEGYLRVFHCDHGERSAAALLFNADRELGPKQILLALNPHFEDHKIHLYDVDGSAWRPVADIWNFDMKGIDDSRLNEGERNIYLGHMTLGLWVRE